MLPLASTATLFPESPLELPKRLAHLICPARLKRAIQQSVTPGLAAVSLPVPKSMLPKKYPVATKSPFDMTARQGAAKTETSTTSVAPRRIAVVRIGVASKGCSTQLQAHAQF